MHLSLIPATCIAHIILQLFIIQYNLTKIILQSVADHNCNLRSTAVYFASAATEASNKTFHWLITSHPNLTCPFLLHIFHYISFVPNFSCTLICFVFNFNFQRLGPDICAISFSAEHYITCTLNQEIHNNVFNIRGLELQLRLFYNGDRHLVIAPLLQIYLHQNKAHGVSFSQ